MSKAERAVLGAAMLSTRVRDEMQSIITPDDFERWQDAEIWKAITRLSESAQGVDVVTVTDELLRVGELERVGGADYLHGLTSEVPTAANGAYYAEILAGDALKRRIREASVAVAEIANGIGNPEEMGERARAEIDAATRRGIRDAQAVWESLDETLAALAEAPQYRPTVWKHLNDLISGLMPGGLYVIGARPGSGKTIMGLQAAAELAKHGAVAFSSLEMSTADLTKRLFASLGGIHMTNLTRNSLSPSAWKVVADLRPQISKLPLYIDDRSHVTVAQIRAHARSVKRRHGTLAGIVVDYLQLISSGDARRPRHEVVGEISRSLKILARELQVPVIALSQLNRNSENGARPTLADLRESGTIEQDADVVILLQRETDPEGVPTDELYVGVAKNRQGQTGDFPLVWEGQFARVLTAPWLQ